MQHLLKGMSEQRAWTPMLIVPCPEVILCTWVPAAEQMWSHTEKMKAGLQVTAQSRASLVLGVVTPGEFLCQITARTSEWGGAGEDPTGSTKCRWK